MNYEYRLGLYSDVVKERINSSQFALSEEILKIRFENNLSPFDMAEILNLSPNEYMRYEDCDLRFSVLSYREVVNKLKRHFSLRDYISKVFMFHNLYSYDTFGTESIEKNLEYSFAPFKQSTEINSNVLEVA